MDDKELKKLKKQHIDNYRNSILDIISNNTSVLVDEDISSLIKKPPLDSMDFLKKKILSSAKKNKIVVKSEALDHLLEIYRKDLLKCCLKIKKIRQDSLSLIVKKIKLEKNTDVIKINKKDFAGINREIKKLIKEQFYYSREEIFLKKINSIFPKDIDSDLIDNVVSELKKYVQGIYQKQLLENIDIKIMVKDTTLINSVKEQAERYLFTLKNSRLLNDNLNKN